MTAWEWLRIREGVPLLIRPGDRNWDWMRERRRVLDDLLDAVAARRPFELDAWVRTHLGFGVGEWVFYKGKYLTLEDCVLSGDRLVVQDATPTIDIEFVDDQGHEDELTLMTRKHSPRDDIVRLLSLFREREREREFDGDRPDGEHDAEARGARRASDFLADVRRRWRISNDEEQTAGEALADGGGLVLASIGTPRPLFSKGRSDGS